MFSALSYGTILDCGIQRRGACEMGLCYLGHCWSKNRRNPTSLVMQFKLPAASQQARWSLSPCCLKLVHLRRSRPLGDPD